MLKDLRLHELIESSPIPYTIEDVPMLDFTILGLSKSSPSYDKGRKTRADYLNSSGEVVISKTFVDAVDGAGALIGLDVTFDWYNIDGTIGLSKTERVKDLNKYEAETVRRKRRERSIDYLVAGAQGTPIEAYLNAVFDHYYDVVLKYKNKGTSEFEDAVNGEADPTINAYLAIVIGLNDDNTPKTVKQSILEEVA